MIYRFDNKGCLATGFQTFPDGTRYYNTDGTLEKGFLKVDKNTYYFATDGKMQTGFVTVSGSKYYFATDGKMQTGFVTISGSKYYFNTSGKMQTGFVTVSGSKYYFGTDGKMKTGWQTINSKKYYFGSDGIMKTGWQTIDSTKYYFDSNGVLTATEEDKEITKANEYINEVLRLVNIERAKEGKSALTLNEKACEAAAIRCKEITNLFSHTRPDGTTCFTVLTEVGLSNGACGENIAFGYSTPADVMYGWMHSDGHRRNILDSYYSKIGIGYYQGYWVQLFIG